MNSDKVPMMYLTGRRSSANSHLVLHVLRHGSNVNCIGYDWVVSTRSLKSGCSLQLRQVCTAECDAFESSASDVTYVWIRISFENHARAM
jgi:hypothetical protein